MKLLFVDLDETLLSTDKTISEDNLKAIERMVDAGHGFVINTGRPFLSAYKIVKRYGFNKNNCFLSVFNGSQIYNAKDLKLLFKTGVEKEIARVVFESAAEFNIHVHTYTEDKVVAERKTDMLLQYCKDVDMEYIIVEDAVSFVDKELPKIICADLSDHEKLVKFQNHMKPIVDGKLYNLFSNPRLLEFGSLYSSKGRAIEELSKVLNVSVKDTYSVGDEENDIDMIKTAGTGFAMLNGKETVKEVADIITEFDNNNGGVAWIINNFIL